jgi:hypothetical protein
MALQSVNTNLSPVTLFKDGNRKLGNQQEVGKHVE